MSTTHPLERWLAEQTEPSVPVRVLGRGPAFVAASVALVLVFASSGSPIPLYNLYRRADGIGTGSLAITTVTYLAVTALALLTLGRLSDHLGRRPVSLGALISSAIGCLLLTQVHSLPLLLAGRAFQGAACGVAASSLGSWVIDLAPRRPMWLAPLVTSSAPTFGIPLGALVSGVLVESGPAPRTLTYEVVAAALVVTAVVLVTAPQHPARPSGAWRSLLPRVQLPAGERRGAMVAVIAATFLATWSFSGFYQAFAPTITADHLGTDNSVAVAAVFSSIVILSPVGGTLSGRLRPTVAIRLGLVAFTVAVVGAVAALQSGSIAAFLTASLVAGLAQGAATTGAMRAVLADAAPAVRAGLLASVYLVSYAGAAVPGLVASAVAASTDVPVIAGGYAALVLLAAAAAVLASFRLVRPGRTGATGEKKS